MAKTILITGASSGIGKATAALFQAKGWNVIATMRSPENEQELTKHDTVLVTRLDVLDADSIAAAVAAGLEKFGKIDVLVNNAGYGGRCATADVARRLGVSPRTLQRRLGDEGTTFKQELANLRVELAHHYLANPRYTGAEISFLLGYTDPNSFVRAFHGWTGRTPEIVRAGIALQ